MFADPAATPVTIPVADPMVATSELLLIQDPPVVVDDNVELAPIHTVLIPVIVAGEGFTTTVSVFWQARPEVSVMIVVPEEIHIRGLKLVSYT